jgi:uncharacterized membrane protein
MENDFTKEKIARPKKIKRTLSQQYTDLLASAMGSWAFLIVFILLIMVWITVNILMVEYKWDPYPFILLNLALSSISALQAPIILMSQNRQAERDRINARYDYLVDRKAEREIRDMQKDLEEIKDMIRNLKSESPLL